MKPSCRGVMFLALVLGGLLLVAGGVSASSPIDYPDKLPRLQGPVVITTLGQSPGSLMVRMICNSVKLPCVEEKLLTVDQLGGLAHRKDNPCRVLIITMGTSLKGMGAAGINVDSEVKRVQALIATARKLGVTVIGAQIEGPSRRMDETDEKSIRAVTPLSDLLVIRRDVNEDGYFTKTAKEKGIPLILITQALDMQQVFKTLFSL